MRCPRRDKNVYYNRKRIASGDTSSVICFANATFPSKGLATRDGTRREALGVR